MQTRVQNMHNYVGYRRCGEILAPPSGSNQRPYILKCFFCKEIYLLFEAFIFHIEDHCKNLYADTVGNFMHKTSAEHMELSDNFDVKVEDVKKPIQTEDPLNVIKPENFSDTDEIYSTKEDEEPLEANVSTALKNDCEENLTTVEIVCDTDSNESFDISDEDDYQSSDEELELENSSADTNSGEDYDSVIKIENQEKKDFNFNLQTKEHVIAFIEAYQNQPRLWNKNFPCLRYKENRQKCLKEIAEELNKKDDMSISLHQVSTVIVYLLRKYREDLKGVKEQSEGGENYTPSWFFEHLNFLKPFMENNQIAKLDSHMAELQPNQVKEILKIYKSFPHIWNTDMIEHYCKNKVETAKKEMLQSLEEKLNIKITETILENYFRAINNCFIRAKRKMDRPNSNEGKNEATNNDDNKLGDYYEHMLFLKDHVGSFKCSDCIRSFKSPMYLKIHQTNVHGLEPIKCSQCQKPFKSVTAYTNHAKRHMEDLNHECKECGKKFLHSTELRIHMRNHTGVKPFCCEICGASFRHIQGFTNHHRRHIKNFLHSCEICDKGFYSKDRYNDHMNSHSNIRNEVCNVCGKAFITKRSLQQHVVIHDDVRRYSCKLCGKSFKQKTGVNQHMRTHGITNSEDKKSTTKK